MARGLFYDGWLTRGDLLGRRLPPWTVKHPYFEPYPRGQIMAHIRHLPDIIQLNE